ncbi:MAG: outer membrane beta-barrel protein [Bacteroidales bacterium]|nr:outer membrane beta-barrel protein [Bacteroidales bacterium]
MKKIFAIVLGAALMLSATNAFAQLSVGAGWLNTTESTVVTNGNNSNTNNVNLNGFYAGAQYNFAIVSGLGIAPGVYFSGLFGKRTDDWVITTGESKFTELSINVPVNVNYTIGIGSDFNVILYAGPIFQYGVSCKGNYTVGNTTNTTNYYEGDNHRNPFNVYVGGGAGIQAGQFQVLIGYDHSVTNMITRDNTTVGRSQIKLGVGYAF